MPLDLPPRTGVTAQQKKDDLSIRYGVGASHDIYATYSLRMVIFTHSEPGGFGLELSTARNPASHNSLDKTAR
jgi:hypothetical protein